MPDALSKAALRASIQKLMQELPAAEFLSAGLQIANHVEQWLSFDPALLQKRRIALFRSLKDELATAPLADYFLKLGIAVYYPTFDENDAMHFAAGELHQQKLANVDEFDMIFVPGRAFDKKGNRLGRGLGCYDRALTMRAPLKKIPLLIGLALDNQVVERVPAQTHDVRMHFICSPALGLLKTSE